MKTFKIATALVLAMSAVAASPVLAAPVSPVSLHGDVKLEKTVTTAGVAQLVLSEPKVVVPGDRLLFSTAYRNDGTQPVTNFVVTNPLPGAVVLSPESAATLDVSVDGGKSWGKLATIKVSDGKGGQRAAVAADVTHVRWVIPTIAAGSSGTVEYHAIVR